MPKVMKFITVFCFAATVILSVLFYCFGNGIYLTSAIAFGTTFYHLAIRLFIGFLYNLKMNNHADYTKKWYQTAPWESKLYKFLKVKKCKGKLPTYNPESFSLKKHTPKEIAQAMCQSELVHETNIVLSFLPIAAYKTFGAFYVFLITSVCGAVFDLLFVIVQRYNRARIIKLFF